MIQQIRAIISSPLLYLVISHPSPHLVSHDHSHRTTKTHIAPLHLWISAIYQALSLANRFGIGLSWFWQLLATLAFPLALRSLIDGGLVSSNAADKGAQVMGLRNHFFALFAVASRFGLVQCSSLLHRELVG
jgi:hypothetical protein